MNISKTFLGKLDPFKKLRKNSKKSVMPFNQKPKMNFQPTHKFDALQGDPLKELITIKDNYLASFT